MTEDILRDAGALVDEWAKRWQREGRLEGGLDRFAKADLIERFAGALDRATTATKGGKAARVKAND